MKIGIPRTRGAAVPSSPSNAVETATARLADARKVDEAARSNLAAVEAERAAAVTAGDRQAMTSLRPRLLEAQDEADISRDMLARAEAAEQAAIAEQAAARRRDQRMAIEAEVSSVGAWMRERYPALAEEIVEGLKRIVQIEERIFDFNGTAAKGEAHLDGAEQALRPGLPTLPATVVLPALTDAVCLWPSDRTPTPHWSSV